MCVSACSALASSSKAISRSTSISPAVSMTKLISPTSPSSIYAPSSTSSSLSSLPLDGSIGSPAVLFVSRAGSGDVPASTPPLTEGPCVETDDASACVETSPPSAPSASDDGAAWSTSDTAACSAAAITSFASIFAAVNASRESMLEVEKISLLVLSESSEQQREE